MRACFHTVWLLSKVDNHFYYSFTEDAEYCLKVTKLTFLMKLWTAIASVLTGCVVELTQAYEAARDNHHWLWSHKWSSTVKLLNIRIPSVCLGANGNLPAKVDGQKVVPGNVLIEVPCLCNLFLLLYQNYICSNSLTFTISNRRDVVPADFENIWSLRGDCYFSNLNFSHKGLHSWRLICWVFMATPTFLNKKREKVNTSKPNFHFQLQVNDQFLQFGEFHLFLRQW